MERPGRLEIERIASLSYPFGRIGGVAVSSDGRIFVGDQYEKAVLVFTDPAGPPTRIGRDGQGPGEFKNVTDVATTEHYLVVFDGGQRAITSFLLSDLWGRDVRRQIVGNRDRSAFKEIIPSSGDRILLQLTTPLIDYDRTGEGDRLIQEIEVRGQVVRDTVAVVMPDEWLITNGGGGYTAEPMPFGGRSIVRSLPTGDVLTMWTASRQLRLLDPRTAEKRQLSVPWLHRRATSEADLSRTEASMVDAAGVLAPFQMRRFDAAVEDGRLPDSVPYVSGLEVDERGMIFLTPITDDQRQLAGAYGLEWRSNTGQTELAMLDLASGQSWIGSIPANGRLAAVRDGMIYFVEIDASDVETIGIFQFKKATQDGT